MRRWNGLMQQETLTQGSQAGAQAGAASQAGAHGAGASHAGAHGAGAGAGASQAGAHGAGAASQAGAQTGAQQQGFREAIRAQTEAFAFLTAQMASPAIPLMAAQGRMQGMQIEGAQTGAQDGAGAAQVATGAQAAGAHGAGAQS
ncbi:MAG: hypothetical protein ACI4QC_02430 [Thermoguttaceae bacterium]